MDREAFEELKSSAFPLVGNEKGVYLLFEADDLVYVGKGWNCLLRVAEHTRKDSNKIFTSWNFIPVECTEELRLLEIKLIKENSPKYNIHHRC